VPSVATGLSVSRTRGVAAGAFVTVVEASADAVVVERGFVEGGVVDDVVLDDWRMPWNAKPDAGRLAAGVPKSNFWASDPNGINQVGCVYTAQGFEYDFAGVLWGEDLIHRPREGWIGQPSFSHDNVVKRATKDGSFTNLVKHTYRVLLTRGLRGCAVYFRDEPTRDFVLSRIDASKL